MSRSDGEDDRPNRFDDWIGQEYERTNGFTALVVLVAIGEFSITPLRSTWFHVIGDELDWAGVSRLLSGAGADWDGVLFSVLTDEADGGPAEDVMARYELDHLAERLREDRMVLNQNHFFDKWGRRMQIEEVTPQ